MKCSGEAELIVCVDNNVALQCDIIAIKIFDQSLKMNFKIVL